MKKIICFFLLSTFSFLSSAHEFWLRPNRFKCLPGETVGIDFMVGENFEGESWSLKRHSVVRLEQHTRGGTEKITMPLDTARHPVIEATLKSEGGHLFVMQSNNAYLELDAEKFNAYLKEDGLEDAMNYRIRTNTVNNPSREHYQRNAKLLVQCGEVVDETYRKKVGLPLEIIPLSNPYAAKSGDELKFRLIFKDKPHAFALTKVWQKAEGRTFMQNVYTDKEGIITVRVSGKGMWMISSVKMVASEDKAADWQSYWGSLIFGL